MKILRREIDEAFKGTCVNCKQEGVWVRRVKVLGTFQLERGFADMCFECSAPEIWFRTPRGVFHAPVKEGWRNALKAKEKGASSE